MNESYEIVLKKTKWVTAGVVVMVLGALSKNIPMFLLGLTTIVVNTRIVRVRQEKEVVVG